MFKGIISSTLQLFLFLSIPLPSGILPIFSAVQCLPIHIKLYTAFCWTLQVFMGFVFKLSLGSPRVQCLQVDLCRQQVGKSPMSGVCWQKFLSITAFLVSRQELSPLVIFVLPHLPTKEKLSDHRSGIFLRGKCTQVR